MSSLIIVGSGNVGNAIYSNCKRNGVSVRVASRNPESRTEFFEAEDLISLDEALDAGNTFLLALPYGAALEFAQSVADWQNKVLIDATNPVLPGYGGLSVGTDSSAGEEIAKLAVNARVVKAFNTSGAENLANPARISDSIFTPICGDDENTKAAVIDLAMKLGFDAVDFGELKTARYTEPFAMMWIHLALKLQAGRNWAFSRSHEVQ
jgi:8-hydroxy-5-deazaflavin:NADPH oxidoreductase